ncbi:MAG: winged helix-turn-helix transcriptional regulator [Candidatus Thalassarchaeum sp.]|nr:winged helix-turn-helix transcriptional regulator [Candidatus Thalassarchaeum sp.]
MRRRDMPLIQQWRESHPWASDAITAIAAGAFGLASLLPFSPAFTKGTLSSPHDHSWEHPMRGRILRTLERSPGIHFRELQRQLNAPNGTLRHHLRVLSNERSVTIVPINGRTCYYAGAPAQVEILEGTGVTDEATAAAMLPGGLSGIQRKIVNRLSISPAPATQAQLARDLGHSRTTVHSAIGVLRRRGIMSYGRLKLAPHLNGLGVSNIDYPWLEIRSEYV